MCKCNPWDTKCTSQSEQESFFRTVFAGRVRFGGVFRRSLRATTKKWSSAFLVRKSAPPEDKILATPMNLLGVPSRPRATDSSSPHISSACQTSSTHRGQHCSKIMKPPQSLPLQMAERLLCAHPDSVANHVTACSISD